MYKAEVLGKLPVIQHFLFGSILKYEGAIEETSGHDDEHWGHNHATPGKKDFGWGDCCGIPVPSAFAAAKAGAPTGHALGGARPVPFD